MSQKIILMAVGVMIILAILAILSLEPADTYILVIDQRNIEASTAAAVTQTVVNTYPVHELYWVFNLGDSTYFDEVKKIILPKGCQVLMVNSIGFSLAAAEESFAESSGHKCLLFIPSAYPTELDVEILNEVSFEDVEVVLIDPLTGRGESI